MLDGILIIEKVFCIKTNTIPIAKMEAGRAENIAISPTIEKYAATADTASAENKVITINDMLLCLTIRTPFNRFKVF